MSGRLGCWVRRKCVVGLGTVTNRHSPTRGAGTPVAGTFPASAARLKLLRVPPWARLWWVGPRARGCHLPLLPTADHSLQWPNRLPISGGATPWVFPSSSCYSPSRCNEPGQRAAGPTAPGSGRMRQAGGSSDPLHHHPCHRGCPQPPAAQKPLEAGGREGHRGMGRGNGGRARKEWACLSSSCGWG